MGEASRRELFREDGATSAEAWATERYGMSMTTARAYIHVAEKAAALPHLVESMSTGELSFDKVRAVVDVATPETEEELRDEALGRTVRELADVARVAADGARGRRSVTSGRSEHDGRYLRFNDTFHTMTVRLAAESYAATRACLDARVTAAPSDGETPLDQRRCDAFMDMVHESASTSGVRAGGTGDGSGVGRRGGAPTTPYFVVLHAPLDALVDEKGAATDLAGELERDGLIDCATVRRLASDATIAVAVDDDVGHTMYEGRARRFPSPAQRREVMRRDRHCRFPGCSNMTFTNVHHIVPWKPGGTTDLPNLALLCRHHHGVVHRKGWSLSGNANEELEFVNPVGRITRSRPSPLWARVTPGTKRSGPPRS